MIVKGLVTVLVVNGLSIAISIPLILRIVPRNVVYGFRTRTTLADDFVWYEANAHFGRGLVVAALVSALALLALWRTDSVSESFFFAATMAALVVPSLVAMLRTFRFVRSLTPGGPARGPTANVPR